MRKPWHSIQTDSLEKELKSDFENGLSSSLAESRKTEYGLNQLEEKKNKSIIIKFLEQFTDFMVIVLIVAAIVSLFVGEGVDAVIILGIVVLNAVVGVIQEYKAEKSLDALKKMAAPKAKALRDGVLKKIPTEELVPGDIVVLEAGDLVPADGRLIEAFHLKIDESALTGESVPAEKDGQAVLEPETAIADRINMAYSGTIVTYGRGKMIVCETGNDTSVGNIAKMLSEEPESETPLQKKLKEVGKILAIVAIIICAAIFVIGVVKDRSAFDMFILSVSLAVAVIPEGLPAIVTVVLSMGVSSMAKRNAVVKKLPAVETLGSASVICTDKTGTLTQNKMTVVGASTAYKDWVLTDEISQEDKIILKLMLGFSSLCTDVSDSGGTLKGDPTETALVAAAMRFGSTKAKLDRRYPRSAELPFDSVRKCMTVAVEIPGGYRVITKGAPDVLMRKCTSVILEEETAEFSLAIKNEIIAKNAAMANEALRVLAVAFKDVEELPEDLTQLEDDMIFMGLLGMIDPPRKEAVKAIETCKKAGITTVMITGDHVDTAVAIGKQMGIMESDSIAVTGTMLDAMSEEEYREKLKKIRVYARVSPEHKVKIVKAWQELGQVVAMTGDGVNDAPALKAADIGCAMGITGTDVAKSAADMVLTDDNFATIVDAVRQGRGIFSNIRKCIQFLLSSNIGEVILLLIAILILPEMPLLPIHVLWINLVTDSLPAIALGMEPAEKNVMNKRPRNPKKSVFAGGLWGNILWQGLMIGLLSLTAFIVGRYFIPSVSDAEGLLTGRTMAFAVLAISQLVHAFNVRTELSMFRGGFFRNPAMWGAFAAALALQLCVLLIPGLRMLFGTGALYSIHWIWIVGLSLVPLVLVELAKNIKSIFVKN